MAKIGRVACAVPNAAWIESIPQLDPLTERGMWIEKRRALPSNDWDAINRLGVDGRTP
jgi:hypothetical protein